MAASGPWGFWSLLTWGLFGGEGLLVVSDSIFLHCTIRGLSKLKKKKNYLKSKHFTSSFFKTQMS